MQISYRYIEMNQVRAGMVRHPAEYPWSSYRMNAFGKHDNMTTPHPLYHALGETEQKRREVYSALIGQQLNETSLKAIREATNKAWVLGTSCFKEKIEARINRQIDSSTERRRQEIRGISSKNQSSLTLLILKKGNENAQNNT
ncbi:MAG: hypothetical protein QTN59_09875 [Candidatus Electrothrix communis]|nr:MAG: hypothetical protein QTN59_09875 [Candidatus Electrothrix communis]